MNDSGAPRDGLASGPPAEERVIGRRRSDRIVGSSRAIQDVIEQAVAAAATDLPVRIAGPAGVGKEQIARAIHGWSARAPNPFVVTSSVGVPEALRGRALFGCAESTYPGMPEAHDGSLARAAGGTLLVDHADLLGSDLWQALAKALADRRFQREGDGGPIPLTARVIAVSRSPLPSSVLRELPHHEIIVPPLAERSEDILPLATHFLGLAASEAEVEAVGFTGEARTALLTDPWPGNARELAERVGQALRLCRSGAITAEALLIAAPPDQIPSFKDAKRAFERRYVTGLLRRCDGNISRAARLAKKDRKDFYDVIRRTGVDPTEFR
ncbi:MAG TPA: sigma 54-interacting transcriptional regulator [Myxococcota bacterium]|nr:sigma 54-interacting transcriptional regulator [Myxococcota bacterium]